MPDPAEVLLLGDQRLRIRSSEIETFDDSALGRGLEVLAATLHDFRRRYGFGRAISAPQIGLPVRAIAMNLGAATFFVINPVVTWQSDETFTMWDDCMSFPDLLVRVRRNSSLSLEYADESGKLKEWRELGTAESELLQHEIDHLDGVLAVDRAIDSDSLVMRREFEARRETYAAQVDYVIG